MIEEAAGTSLYESKKLTVQKTIAKKEAKLRDINRVLHVVKYTFFYFC